MNNFLTHVVFFDLQLFKVHSVLIVALAIVSKGSQAQILTTIWKKQVLSTIALMSMSTTGYAETVKKEFAHIA